MALNLIHTNLKVLWNLWRKCRNEGCVHTDRKCKVISSPIFSLLQSTFLFFGLTQFGWVEPNDWMNWWDKDHLSMCFFHCERVFSCQIKKDKDVFLVLKFSLIMNFNLCRCSDRLRPKMCPTCSARCHRPASFKVFGSRFKDVGFSLNSNKLPAKGD